MENQNIENSKNKRSVGRPRKVPISLEEQRKINRGYQAKRNLHSYDCECGATVKVSNKYKHFKTKKHVTKMELLNALKKLDELKSI